MLKLKKKNILFLLLYNTKVGMFARDLYNLFIRRKEKNITYNIVPK